MLIGYLFSGKILIFSLAIKAMAVAGSIYLIFNLFVENLWTSIVEAHNHEASSNTNLRSEIAELEQEYTENKKTVSQARAKITAIEAKIAVWLTKNQAEQKDLLSQQQKLAIDQNTRARTIDANLQDFLQAKAVVKELKEQVFISLGKIMPTQMTQATNLLSEADFDDFTSVTSVAGKTSFIYAKVFLGFLTKHNLLTPSPEFLISLSQTFKSNEFFFFAKGGLLEQDPLEHHNPSDNTEKICVLSCKKTLCSSTQNPKCCLCCYQWHDMLSKIKIDPYLQRFIEIIIARDAQKIISDVLKELAFMIYSNRGELLCEVESTHVLNEAEITQICDKIFQLYNLKPVCIFKINPCLMGGVLIRSNRFRIDSSVYGYLNKVFYKLDSVNA